MGTFPQLLRAASGLLCAASLGCASLINLEEGGHFRYFEQPVPSTDPWYGKVENWQSREREHRPQEALADADGIREAGPRSGLLRVKMGRWTAKERLAMVKRIATWSQQESRRHYRFDPPTDYSNDPWPTTKDLLDQNGDDCDGLDLITYKLMRSFGYPRGELFRAIVKRQRDGANHMVTLWFEDPKDPWVVDATGAVTMTVRRFSQLPGWTPTKVFNEEIQFTPVPLGVNRFAHSD
jgi:hypothetical protein